MLAGQASGNVAASDKGKGKDLSQRADMPATRNGHLVAATSAQSTPLVLSSPSSRAPSPADSSSSASSSVVDRVPTPDWLVDFKYDVNDFEEYLEGEEVVSIQAKDDNIQDKSGVRVRVRCHCSKNPSTYA